MTFDEQALQRTVFSKPNSAATMSKLQLSFLADLSATLNFKAERVQWFASKVVSVPSIHFLVAALIAQTL